MFDVRERKVQHYKHIVIKYSHVRLKITTSTNNIATRVVVSETESCMKCLICLFGDEVRLYFIVFRPACSASRCDRASFHRLKKA